jgi:hypothetical protein
MVLVESDPAAIGPLLDRSSVGVRHLEVGLVLRITPCGGRYHRRIWAGMPQNAAPESDSVSGRYLGATSHMPGVADRDEV